MNVKRQEEFLKLLEPVYQRLWRFALLEVLQEAKMAELPTDHYVKIETIIPSFRPIRSRSLDDAREEQQLSHVPILHNANYRASGQEADRSGITFGVGNHFTVIPGENNISGRALNEVDMSVGYRFNAYHKLSVEFGTQTFRRFSETSHTIEVINVSTGQKSFVHTSTFTAIDDLIKVPGLSYTFTAHNLDVLAIEPAVVGFAGITGAGFLWRAGAGLEWTPVDRLSLNARYTFEKRSSVGYSALQSQRSMLGIELEYLW